MSLPLTQILIKFHTNTEAQNPNNTYSILIPPPDPGRPVQQPRDLTRGGIIMNNNDRDIRADNNIDS